MVRTRMRPSKWVMLCSVRGNGPNSQRFVSKGATGAPPVVASGSSRKGAAEEI